MNHQTTQCLKDSEMTQDQADMLDGSLSELRTVRQLKCFNLSEKISEDSREHSERNCMQDSQKETICNSIRGLSKSAASF